MTDLTTTYLGLKLKNPLVVSAAQPLSMKVNTVKRLEDAGVSAVVMYSYSKNRSFVKALNWIIISLMAQNRPQKPQVIIRRPGISLWHLKPI